MFSLILTPNSPPPLLFVSIRKPLKYFLPTLTMPSSFRHAISKRLFAFAWLNIAGGLLLASLSAIALLGFRFYPHFINDAAGIPLTYLMLIKAASSLYTASCVLRNSDLGDFLK